MGVYVSAQISICEVQHGSIRISTNQHYEGVMSNMGVYTYQHRSALQRCEVQHDKPYEGVRVSDFQKKVTLHLNDPYARVDSLNKQLTRC